MAGGELSFQTEERDGVHVVHVSGPLDSMTYDVFRAQLDPLVNRVRARIVLDCERLSYVNSKGLTLLARYQRIAVQTFTFFGVAALPARIVKSIEMLGMGRLLKSYATVAEALQAARP